MNPKTEQRCSRVNFKWLAAVVLAANTAFGAEDNLYLVVDLSGGPEAARYPVRYSPTPPDLDDDTCRTTELWLRRIPAGTFVMGSPEGEIGRGENEFLHRVTLTEDFYIGVFQMTQKQYELARGFNPAKYLGDTRPVESLSYNTLRGKVEDGINWPQTGSSVTEGSFLGGIRAKTGLTFDLPTEAQWEYACRAGTTTALNNGKNLTGKNRCPNMDELGRYVYNKNDGKGGESPKTALTVSLFPALTFVLATAESVTRDARKGAYLEHTKVGMYPPNAWGLYDMHGNVWEWCLDWYTENLSTPEMLGFGGAFTREIQIAYQNGTLAATDPKGPVSGRYRLWRGGGGKNAAHYNRSAHRYYYTPGNNGGDRGFRICVLLAPVPGQPLAPTPELR